MRKILSDEVSNPARPLSPQNSIDYEDPKGSKQVEVRKSLSDEIAGVSIQKLGTVGDRTSAVLIAFG